MIQRLSEFLYEHPALLFQAQRIGMQVAARLLDLTAAFRLSKRPEWVSVFRPDRSFTLDFSESPASGANELAFVQRVVESYKRAYAETLGNRGVEDDTIWGVLLEKNYARLHSTVVSGDTIRSAEYLRKVFQTEAVDGFTMGTWFEARPHRWWWWGVGVVTSIIGLAEACGLLRAECPEQGQTGYALSGEGLDGILKKLDHHFGFRIESPRTGSARGIAIQGRFITRETCSQIYTAERVRQAFDCHIGETAPMDIVEIGGGFGGLCYWMLKVCGERVRRYELVDLPATGLIQSYFLGSVLNERIALYGEKREGARISLCPHFALDSIPSPVNIIINQDSMPEMPPSEVERYLDWGSRNLDGIFLSFNQEAYSIVHGRAQLFTPGFFASYPAFRRVSRTPAWDRRGYVEEVYIAKSSHGK